MKITLYVGPRRKGPQAPMGTPDAPWDGEDPGDSIPQIRVALREGGAFRCIASGEVTVMVAQAMVMRREIRHDEVEILVWDETRPARGVGWCPIKIEADGALRGAWPQGFYPWRERLVRARFDDGSAP